MPVIVKLHLLFLADSKFGPFLKTKRKEINILKEKNPNPNVLYLLSSFLCIQFLSSHRLLEFFSLRCSLNAYYLLEDLELGDKNSNSSALTVGI